MAFNQKGLLHYLYYNNTGEFLRINEALKDGFKEVDIIPEVTQPDGKKSMEYWANYDEIINGISPLVEQNYIDRPDTTFDEYNYMNLGEIHPNIRITLDTLEIKAKITEDGCILYQKAYLHGDEIESQNKLRDSMIQTNISVQQTNNSIISANTVIKCTYIILAITAIIGAVGIWLNWEAARLSRVQLDKFRQEDKRELLVSPKLNSGDSIKKP